MSHLSVLLLYEILHVVFDTLTHLCIQEYYYIYMLLLYSFFFFFSRATITKMCVYRLTPPYWFHSTLERRLISISVDFLLQISPGWITNRIFTQVLFWNTSLCKSGLQSLKPKHAEIQHCIRIASADPLSTVRCTTYNMVTCTLAHVYGYSVHCFILLTRCL